MSGELQVKESPQDMSAREVVQWQCTYANTFVPTPTEGTAYVYDVTNGEPGSNVTSTMMPSGAASASSGTIIAPLMYGSAGTAGNRYKVLFIGVQSSQRCEQQLIINLKP